MPQGDKSSYTNKQKRQAEHIEEGYERRGGRLGGRASASRPKSARSASAKKAAATRRRRADGAN